MKLTKNVSCETLGLCELADAFALVEVQGQRVEEVRLHPLDFRALLKGHGIIVAAEGAEGEVGSLWGVKVFADPTFPVGLVHVRGKSFYATVSTHQGLGEPLMFAR